MSSIELKKAYSKFYRKIQGRINKKGNFVPFKRKERKICFKDVNLKGRQGWMKKFKNV